MKRYLIGMMVAACMLVASTAQASTILVSTTGALGDANTVFKFQFVYNPVTMGSTLFIQTYGYGGTANAPGGRNATGSLIGPGGFDPIVGLFAGGIGGNGALQGSNDDGICGPGFGATHLGICFDSTMIFTGLAAGTYTLSLTAFAQFPPATENVAFGGGGSFNGRANNFAVDVIANVPEPATSVLLGSGLLALAAMARRRARK